MTGKDAGVAVRERLCRAWWGMHAGAEAREMAAAVERLKPMACRDMRRRKRESFLTESHPAAAGALLARHRGPSTVGAEEGKAFKSSSDAVLIQQVH